MFDLEEARKAIARVRERSIGPETVKDLAGLLEAATTRVATLQAEQHTLTTRIATEREQLHNGVADADRAVLAAIQERDAAIETERNHAQIVTLAMALDRAVTDLEAAQFTMAEQRADQAAAQHTHDQTIAAAAQTEATIRAELAQVRARDAAHAATLARIADLAWWERFKGVTLARDHESQ